MNENGEIRSKFTAGIRIDEENFIRKGGKECTQVKFEYCRSDYYGPSMKGIITQQGTELPVMALDGNTYDSGDVSVSIGKERLAEIIAREYYKKRGNFYLVSKFGKILINSENTREIIEAFRKSIEIF